MASTLLLALLGFLGLSLCHAGYTIQVRRVPNMVKNVGSFPIELAYTAEENVILLMGLSHGGRLKFYGHQIYPLNRSTEAAVLNVDFFPQGRDDQATPALASNYMFIIWMVPLDTDLSDTKFLYSSTIGRALESRERYMIVGSDLVFAEDDTGGDGTRFLPVPPSDSSLQQQLDDRNFAITSVALGGFSFGSVLAMFCMCTRRRRITTIRRIDGERVCLKCESVVRSTSDASAQTSISVRRKVVSSSSGAGPATGSGGTQSVPMMCDSDTSMNDVVGGMEFAPLMACSSSSSSGGGGGEPPLSSIAIASYSPTAAGGGPGMGVGMPAMMMTSAGSSATVASSSLSEMGVGTDPYGPHVASAAFAFTNAAGGVSPGLLAAVHAGDARAASPAKHVKPSRIAIEIARGGRNWVSLDELAAQGGSASASAEALSGAATSSSAAALALALAQYGHGGNGNGGNGHTHHHHHHQRGARKTGGGGAGAGMLLAADCDNMSNASISVNSAVSGLNHSTTDSDGPSGKNSIATLNSLDSALLHAQAAANPFTLSLPGLSLPPQHASQTQGHAGLPGQGQHRPSLHGYPTSTPSVVSEASSANSLTSATAFNANKLNIQNVLTAAGAHSPATAAGMVNAATTSQSHGTAASDLRALVRPSKRSKPSAEMGTGTLDGDDGDSPAMGVGDARYPFLSPFAVSSDTMTEPPAGLSTLWLGGAAVGPRVNMDPMAFLREEDEAMLMLGEGGPGSLRARASSCPDIFSMGVGMGLDGEAFNSNFAYGGEIPGDLNVSDCKLDDLNDFFSVSGSAGQGYHAATDPSTLASIPPPPPSSSSSALLSSTTAHANARASARAHANAGGGADAGAGGESEQPPTILWVRVPAPGGGTAVGASAGAGTASRALSASPLPPPTASFPLPIGRSSLTPMLAAVTLSRHTASAAAVASAVSPTSSPSAAPATMSSSSSSSSSFHGSPAISGTNTSNHSNNNHTANPANYHKRGRAHVAQSPHAVGSDYSLATLTNLQQHLLDVTQRFNNNHIHSPPRLDHSPEPQQHALSNRAMPTPNGSHSNHSSPEFGPMTGTGTGAGAGVHARAHAHDSLARGVGVPLVAPSSSSSATLQLPPNALSSGSGSHSPHTDSDDDTRSQHSQHSQYSQYSSASSTGSNSSIDARIRNGEHEAASQPPNVLAPTPNPNSANNIVPINMSFPLSLPSDIRLSPEQLKSLQQHVQSQMQAQLALQLQLQIQAQSELLSQVASLSGLSASALSSLPNVARLQPRNGALPSSLSSFASGPLPTPARAVFDNNDPAMTGDGRTRRRAAHKAITKPRQVFLCDHPGCGEPFATRYSLRRHMKRHTGEKPHTCEVCNRKFAERSTLLRHHQIHTGEKPFRCTHEDCERVFADMANLRHHQRSVHNLEA